MQKQFETYKERVPSWALCYIVNGDIDGLTDEEIQMINNWLNVNDYEIVSPVMIAKNISVIILHLDFLAVL